MSYTPTGCVELLWEQQATPHIYGCTCGSSWSTSPRSHRGRSLHLRDDAVLNGRSDKVCMQINTPVPKSQSASSPSTPAPRGEVSGKTSAMPASAASRRNPPFHGLRIWDLVLHDRTGLPTLCPRCTSGRRGTTTQGSEHSRSCCPARRRWIVQTSLPALLTAIGSSEWQCRYRTQDAYGELVLCEVATKSFVWGDGFEWHRVEEWGAEAADVGPFVTILQSFFSLGFASKMESDKYSCWGFQATKESKTLLEVLHRLPLSSKYRYQPEIWQLSAGN